MNAAGAVASIKAVQVALIGLATLQLTTFLWPQSSTVEDGSSFDFIIIGAGTAGSVLANRLSENENCSILVIEAGGDPPLESVLSGLFSELPRSKYDWNFITENDGYTSQAHKGGYLEMTAGKMLGGSSSLNHLIYSRGFPYDYDNWAATVGDNTWNYTNIFKYFIKSERLEDPGIFNSTYKDQHGLNGNIGTTREPHSVTNIFFESIKEIGYKVVLDTVEHVLAFSDPLFTIANGVRQSTAYGYLRPIRDKRSNLKILKETLVTKIIFDKNKVAIGVNAQLKDDKKLTLKTKNEVILSAGVFNSPQLLMLSGIGMKSELNKFNISLLSDLPVGKNLQDHVSVFLVHTVGNLPLISPVQNPTEFPLPGMVGFVALNDSQSYPDYQALNFIFQSPSVFSQICAYIFSLKNSFCDNLNKALEGKELYVSLPAFLHPNSRGQVRLKSSNPKDKPIIKTGFFSDKSDIGRMIAYIEDNLRIANTTYFKQKDAKLVDPKLPSCGRYTFRSKEYWRCYILNMATSLFHYTSTCSMGSVVDAQLKVFGVENLRVVDASVIPNITSGTPEIPVIVVAEKAADMIKQKYYVT